MAHGAKCNCFLCSLGKALGLVEVKEEKKVVKKKKATKKRK